MTKTFSSSGVNARDLTSEDHAILERVEQHLADGLNLLRWQQNAEARRKYEGRFELQRSFNRASNSYGFFGTATVQGKDIPIMGNVQDMLYDQIKAPDDIAAEDTEWTRRQLREFVMRYFMRVSSFRRPQAAVADEGVPVPSWLNQLSWSLSPEVFREGFGFSQLYYKTAAGELGKFSDTSAIVDMRDIGDKYEWIVLRVKIFNFSVPIHPFGARGPEIVFNVDEESYIVVSRAFLRDRERPDPGILGEYGVGYAFIKNPKTGFLAFGPGEFAAAFQQIQFRISDSGAVKVHMVFVVNQPDKVASVSLDPVGWSFRLADMLSLGLAAPLLDPVRAKLSKFPGPLGTFDPVLFYVDLLKFVTRGQSEDKLCISREQLNKRFLLQHFMQHYETVAAALFTWRQIPDWLNTSALPPWVVMGRSS